MGRGNSGPTCSGFPCAWPAAFYFLLLFFSSSFLFSQALRALLFSSGGDTGRGAKRGLTVACERLFTDSTVFSWGNA